MTSNDDLRAWLAEQANPLASCPPRWATRRTNRPSLGPAVGKVAAALGTPLMPWQQYVADVACEIDPATGLFVYREVGLTVPRQSGKTTLILAKSTQRCISQMRQVIKYACQSRNDARQKWEDDYVAALDTSRFYGQYRVRKTNGNEAVIWKQSLSRFGITSTTDKAGHGQTLDEAYVDEAFAQEDNRLEQGFKPAMITRKGAQLWVVSTAGKPKKSLYLKGKVEKGRKAVERGLTKGVAYFEWSLDDDEDPADRRNWRRTMPALGHTVTEDAIHADFLSMDLDEFRRAYLNQWVDEGRSEPVIPLAHWKMLTDETSQIVGGLAFGIDSTPDRSRTSITAYGMRADGLFHGEIIDVRDGVSWVVDRVVDLVDRWKPRTVVIDQQSSAAVLVRPLQERRVPVSTTNARQLVEATGRLYDAVTGDKFRHRGDGRFLTALKVAEKRDLEGAWTWSRRRSGEDISCLVALTLAEHGFMDAPPPYDVLDSVVDTGGDEFEWEDL